MLENLNVNFQDNLKAVLCFKESLMSLKLKKKLDCTSKLKKKLFHPIHRFSKLRNYVKLLCM